MPAGRVIDERSIVNGIIGLNATGGSTNHLLHLVAIAAAAGIQLELEDFDAISRVTPLLARVYPNGYADVNHFHSARRHALPDRHAARRRPAARRREHRVG